MMLFNEMVKRGAENVAPRVVDKFLPRLRLSRDESSTFWSMKLQYPDSLSLVAEQKAFGFELSV